MFQNKLATPFKSSLLTSVAGLHRFLRRKTDRQKKSKNCCRHEKDEIKIKVSE